MSKLKLFGFTEEEQRSLQIKVEAEQWEAGQAEELSAPRPADEVWVVGVSASEEFLNAVFPLWSCVPKPKAVLWVPHGKKPLTLADWWEGFHAQLREESEEDRSFLERVSRCVRVLDWGEQVEDIPAKLFAELMGSPRLYGVDNLPFNEAEKQHLSKCADCREEAYERLQGRAKMRWEMLCPSVDDIAEWLEAEKEGRQLEAHVSNCELCQETVKRQAWLWEGAGLVTAEQVNAKLAAVGIAEPVVKPGIADAWLAAALAWQLARAQTAVAWASLLAAALCHHTALSPAFGRRGGTEVSIPLEQLLINELSDKEALELTSEEQWFSLTVEGEAVLVEVGESPARPFEQFRMEFRRGDEVVVEVEAKDGVALLTLEHFQMVQQKQADRLVILKLT